MKTIWTLFLGMYLTVNFATAQDTLYVYKAGAILYKQAINGIDSVTFQKLYTSIKDIDGNVYQAVTIGTQTWMTSNLRVTHYRNGDPIPNETNNATWGLLTSGAQCTYNNTVDTDAIFRFGRLYNYYAVNDVRNIAPTGWHVATNTEWSTLMNYVFNNKGTSLTIQKALAATTDWRASTNSGDIGCNPELNNSTGFTALPCGSRIWNTGIFAEINSCAYWWTKSGTPRNRYTRGSTIVEYYGDERAGFAVRCIKD